MFFANIIIILVLVILLYNYRSGIITSFMVVTNFGEFVYVNPTLEVGDFGGIGTIFFMDLFWIAVLIVLILKKDKLFLLNYKLSLIILGVLFVIALVIPILLNSFAIKDLISVIRPLGNFLFLPYFVVTITNIKELNFFEHSIVTIAVIFICVQGYEYLIQKRIPLRLFDKYSIFYGEDPYSVEFSGIRTGYIWSRIGYLLPFNLFFGCYYYFSEKRNYGLFLIVIYLLAIIISLSRIWIIGFGFFLLVITLFFLFEKQKENYVLVKLFSLLGSFVLLGVILVFVSATFNQIFGIFLLRINSINDLAERTDSSFLSREYILLQMSAVWLEYPLFGTGFSTITRRLTTNDLGLPNIITIFGAASIVMMISFLRDFYNNIKPLIQNYYTLYASLFSVMLMLFFMSMFSIDMFYYNATGAILFALANIILNIGKESS